jgi:hypothetical protein
MQIDPVTQWTRLTEHYAQMSDQELYELHDQRESLTETAQQVLRDEMRKRRLPEDEPAASVPPALPIQPTDFFAEEAENQEESEAGDDRPREFTWKTLLCECDEPAEAWQIHEVLRLAGIESWIEGPRSSRSLDPSSPRVVVAADQFDQALEIARRPIPPEIVELSRMEPDEFETPVCPSCGADDPVLVGVDPVNAWECEACGKEWSDPAQ